MSAQKETIVFFGATGGCTANVLARSLKAGYSCVALARTPEKLRNLLEKEHSISSATIDKHLTITQGNIMDENAVKAALTTTGHLPDKIVYGIGAAPKFHANPFNPISMDQPNICGDGMKVLTSALSALQREGASLAVSGKKPTVVCVSTTGISNARDVPVALLPLYKVLLHTPHVDKRNMEAALLAKAHEQDSPIGAFTIVKPTLLTDGAAKPLEQVRAGWLWPDGFAPSKQSAQMGRPEMGYLISRASVGLWIFERCVKGGSEWEGKCVSLA